MTHTAEIGLVTIGPATSCHVGPEIASQWRNGPHWHAVWPFGEGSWCYPTSEAAQERANEVNWIWCNCPHLRPRVIPPEVTA